MPSQIVIIGLGPGGAEYWTTEAQKALAQCAEVYLRTARHPGAEALPAHLTVYSFDDLYEASGDFPQVYEAIAERVVALGERDEGVAYAVPGHPNVGEATVPLIREEAARRGIPVRVVAGLSFIEPSLSALGIDALDNLQLSDAGVIALRYHPPLDCDRPALIAQLYSQPLAAEVKLTLMNAYPAEHQVFLVRAAGTPEEVVESCLLFELDRQQGLNHLTTLYVPPLPQPSSLPSLQESIAHLRSPSGCPWDREQTHRSLRPYLLEEAYEVLAALDGDDSVSLCEEFGDLLLQIVLHAQIATEEGAFTMANIITGIDGKIRRRHPHVFGDLRVSGTAEVLKNWEKIKDAERNGPGEMCAEGKSLLDSIPQALPALAQAMAVSQRAVRVGFDWPDSEGVLSKVHEELNEVRVASSNEEREAELGDLLFALVNYARWLGVDPESALRTANQRFVRRFKKLEQLAAEAGVTNLSALPIQDLDSFWEAAKEIVG